MRIEQNRANAQHSTSPKSEEGKAKSSRNATRHGLTGKQVIINGEDQQAYEALRKDLIDSYKPANAAEAMLVDEIAQGFWRLQRARALEAEQFNLCCGGADPIIGFNSGNADFERLRRYMTSIERAYHRAIQQLEKTQSLRAKSLPEPPAPPARPREVGFVSQFPKAPENRDSQGVLTVLRPTKADENARYGATTAREWRFASAQNQRQGTHLLARAA